MVVAERSIADPWCLAYDALAPRLPLMAAAARPVLLGFSAFNDVVVALAEAGVLFTDAAPQPARRLAEELARRTEAGIGGEIRIDWPEGDAWLASNLPYRTQAGGTSLQIANVLSLLGMPSLMALGDRSREQLKLVGPGVRLATAAGDLCSRQVASVEGTAKARHWIFEASAGTRIDGRTVRRSTRVIVRLNDDGPERDPFFETRSVAMAPDCGAAAISSLVSTPDAMLDEALAFVSQMAGRWRDAGVGLIHLEMADYGARPHLPGRILGALRDKATSVGMSLSEWRSNGGSDRAALVPSMLEFARQHRLARLCVHADDWAASVTRGSPDQERTALMTGCLLASSRAVAGEPVVPAGCPQGARFLDPGIDADLGEGWHAVGCPSPYTPNPRSTIGLGDTFVAGCLLVHAGGAACHQTFLKEIFA